MRGLFHDMVRPWWDATEWERRLRESGITWPYCRHGKLAEPCADCQRMVGDPHCVRWLRGHICDRPRSAHPLVDCDRFQRAGDPP